MHYAVGSNPKPQNYTDYCSVLLNPTLLVITIAACTVYTTVSAQSLES